MGLEENPSEELGRLAHFAEPTGGDQALERQRQRLAGDHGPSTAASTSRWVNWNDITNLGGNHFDATRIPLNKLIQMRKDPMIAFGLLFIKVFLCRAKWYIKSPDAQRAAFIDYALRDIYGRFVLAYCGCLDFGYQALVKNFERKPVDWLYADPSDPDGKEIPIWDSNVQPLVWKPFTALSPRRVSPAFNQAGEFNGIWLRPASSGTWPFEGMGDPDVPLDWAMWATNEKDSSFGSLYGYPRVGYAYRYWWSYWYRFGLADRAFEKWADPPVIAYHPVEITPGPDGKIRDLTQEGLDLAEKLRSGANVSLPSGAVTDIASDRMTNLREWSLEQLTTTVDFTALSEAFGYLDVAKLRAMMIPEQAFLEGKGGTSSRNVASTLGDVFEESQAVLLAEIHDHINRFMIPQLVEANFGPGGPTCKIESTGLDDQDIQTMRALIQAFAQNDPLRLSAIDFRQLLSRMGIPLLGAGAAKKATEEMIKEIQASKPGPRPPGPGGEAGVTARGFYYNDGSDYIRLSEGETSFVDRALGMFRRKKAAA